MLIVRDLLIWLDSNSSRYVMVACLFLAAAACLAFVPIIQKSRGIEPDRRFWRALTSPVFFVLFLFLCILAVRWPLLFYPGELCMDESLMIAQAQRLYLDLLPWRSSDFQTGGPLLSYLLVLGKFVGLEFGYISARLMGIICVWSVSAMTYLTMRELFSEEIGRIGVLPMLLFYASAVDANYVHYSSEHVPVALIATGLYFGVRGVVKTPCCRLMLFLSGVFLGAVAFAKLQGLPVAMFVAAMIGIGALAQYGLRAGVPKVVFLGIGVASIPAVFLTIVLAQSLGEEFWTSHFKVMSIYGVPFLPPDEWTAYLLMSNEFLPWLVGILVAAFGCILVVRIYNRELFRAHWLLALMIVGNCLASTFVILKPGRPYQHYLHFLIPPLCLLAGFLLFLALESIKKPRSEWPTLSPGMLVGAFVLLFFLPVAGATGPDWLYLLGNQRNVLGDQFFAGGRFSRTYRSYGNVRSHYEGGDHLPIKLLKKISRKGDTMAVWGRHPDIYVTTGLSPAVRDSNTGMALANRADIKLPQELRQHFRDRFLVDLQDARPPIFVDSIGMGALPEPYNWADRRDRELFGHETFPALAEFIRTNFVLLAEIGEESNGLRIYVARERDGELRSGKFPGWNVLD